MEAATSLSLATLPAADKLRAQMTSPVIFPLYLSVKLPMGLFAGMRIKTLTPERCEVTVPARWRTLNPFGSMYFAVQAMAAELSTGAPALVACRAADPLVRSLIVGMTAEFTAQATERVTFCCAHVGQLTSAVEEALRTGESVRAQVPTVGTMADGTVVSRFTFSWSFKRSRQGSQRRA
jgi:acyl-coenzyme A thioesterase PaaI-like protein